MPLTPYQELLSFVARADQLVTEADKYLSAAESPEQWCYAEDLRETLVEMRARIEGLAERRGQQRG